MLLFRPARCGPSRVLLELALQIYQRQPFADEQLRRPAMPEVFIFPRQAEDKLRADAGLNAGIAEVSGVVYPHSQEVFETLTEERLRDIFEHDVSLPSAEFEDLKCKVVSLLV